jgi:hypothetical protein
MSEKQLLAKYDQIGKELDEFNEKMKKKYNMIRWDEKCTQEEWNWFLKMVRRKDAIERKLESEK